MMPLASTPSAARKDAGTETRPFLSKRLTKFERNTATATAPLYQVVTEYCTMPLPTGERGQTPVLSGFIWDIMGRYGKAR